MPLDPQTPVLVGAAQYVGRENDPVAAPAPADMLASVTLAALRDCASDNIAALTAAIDTLAAVRLFSDTSRSFPSPFGRYRNLPRAIAKRINAAPGCALYGPVGGNSPQMLINIIAERIAAREADIAIITGGEALATQRRAKRAGLTLNWSEDAARDPEILDDKTRYTSRHEIDHGIVMPINVYPMIENAYAMAKGWSPAAHRAELARLMTPFSRIAARNPHAFAARDAGACAPGEPDATNPYIAYPYTKNLCSRLAVDQAAAIIIMSSAAADRHAIAPSKRVYLRGSADIADKILLSERLDYTKSHAIRVGAAHALDQAGIGASSLAHVDLYSCFPIAVQIAADMIGLSSADPARLTLTGGLPYFGGPGNAYSLHAIAEMVARCRSRPRDWGLVFANGGYLTKHSFGVYSGRPGHARRIEPGRYQRDIDAMKPPRFTTRPSGPGRVEAFTVVHDRGRPAMGLLIGRLADDTRFLAQMPEGFEALMDAGVARRKVVVEPGDRLNIARLV